MMEARRKQPKSNVIQPWEEEEKFREDVNKLYLESMRKKQKRKTITVQKESDEL